MLLDDGLFQRTEDRRQRTEDRRQKTVSGCKDDDEVMKIC